MTARFLKMFLTVLLLSFTFIVGQRTAYAATKSSQTTPHPDASTSITLNCTNYRTYALNPNLELVKSSGDVVILTASNLNGSASVQVSRNGTDAGEYGLPATLWSEIYVDYSSQQSSDYVDACTDWTQGQS